MQYDRDRRQLLSSLTLATLPGVWCGSLAAAQPGPGSPPLWQPAEPTKAAFLARARALRDEAVREGDQAYGAVVVREGVIVGEGRNYVVLQTDPTAHSELLAVRDAARRLAPATSRNATSIPPRLRALCARALSTGRVCVGCSPKTRWSTVSRRDSDVEPGVGHRRATCNTGARHNFCLRGSSLLFQRRR